jgi:hypothetical protein
VIAAKDSEPFDPLVSDHIEETLRTPGWPLIATRIREEAARRIRALIDSGADGDKTRGMIHGLELALKIPEIIAAECRGKASTK